MGLDERQIEQIVEIVVDRLQAEGVDLSQSAEGVPATGDTGDGVFQDIEAAIGAAFLAQKKLTALPLAVRANIIQAIRDTGLANAADYGRLEFDETGLGKAEDNIKKNQSGPGNGRSRSRNFQR